MPGRPAARALLFDEADRVVLIRRIRPGRPVYLTTPGGGVEPGERWEDAAVRECREELGAEIVLGRLAYICYLHTQYGTSEQRFFLARLTRIDASAATGVELHDPARGAYEPVRLDPDDDEVQLLQPPEVAVLLQEHGCFLASRAPVVT